MTDLVAGQLKVKIYEDRKELGASAAKMAAACISGLLKQKEFVNIVFAAAGSQNEFLEAMQDETVDWSRINAFHMDEYIGLGKDAPQQFGIFLKKRFFDKVPLHQIYYLNGEATDIAAECARYSELLRQYPPDIVFMGIGENTHLAFNDPHVADFNDPSLVKVVDLDEACKQQQVNEGCFDDVSLIPAYALTLTIPALLAAPDIFCMVPGASKAEAVYLTLTQPVTEQYPSTILRNHPNTWLFLEKESAAKIARETAI